MSFSNLIEIPQEEIYHTFLKIFNNYKLNVNITMDQFLTLQKRSSYSPEYSFGWFDQDKLVCLIMNGVRTVNSKLICYGIAGGVIPEYRKRGTLIYRVLYSTFSALEKMSVESYVCEMMRDNLPVIKLIQKLGGKISKNTITYIKKIDEIEIDDNLSDSFHFHHENDLSFISSCSTLGCKTTWQNSFEAINAILPFFFITTVRKEDNIIGYGVINRIQGDITQFIIQEEFRDRGLGNLLLLELINNTDSKSVGFFNVDEKNTSLNKFLTKKGFKIYSKDFEIIKDLHEIYKRIL